MQISVEAPSQIQRRITVIVPVEKINHAYDQRIVKLSKTAKINGFRTGKIPLDVIKSRFGDTARQEALSEIIQSSLYSAIDQEKLNPVSVPTVEPKAVIPGQPLEFTATFEILPPIENVQLTAAQIEKEVATIEEDDLTRVIEQLRLQHTQWQEVDRETQEKDQVIVDFRGMVEGSPIAGGEAHEYPIVIGSKKMIPGFEEGLIGLKKGDKKDIPVVFPEHYFSGEIAGKNAVFAVRVIKILAPQLPALDSAFIKKLGVKSGNLDDFRAEIRKNLERELAHLIKIKLKTQVFNKLLEQNALEIPKALIEREAKRVHDELHPHHKGKDHSHTEEEMNAFNESAKRNVALGLLVAELIKKHSIKADKERLQTLLTNVCAAYENPQEVEKWYTSNKKAYSELEMQILEEQVMEKLLEEISVVEKKVSYTDFMKSNN